MCFLLWYCEFALPAARSDSAVVRCVAVLFCSTYPVLILFLSIFLLLCISAHFDCVFVPFPPFVHLCSCEIGLQWSSHLTGKTWPPVLSLLVVSVLSLGMSFGTDVQILFLSVCNRPLVSTAVWSLCHEKQCSPHALPFLLNP